MNHLHELLDSLPFELAFPHCWNAKDAQFVIDKTRLHGTNAICFAMGKIERYLDLKVIPELVLFPYETCWFECEASLAENLSETVVVGVLCHKEKDSPVKMYIFSRLKKLWSVEAADIAEIVSNDSLKYCTHDPIAEKNIDMAWYAVRAFLSAMNCKNVTTIEKKPDDKLQKARKRRGKQPLFSTWTLVISGSGREEKNNLGGTHASPRVHLRRGHPRQYEPGKWTWVQPHAVGNRSLGIVHKDYAMAQP